jgi:hypothetical protein
MVDGPGPPPPSLEERSRAPSLSAIDLVECIEELECPSMEAHRGSGPAPTPPSLPHIGGRRKMKVNEWEEDR